MPAKYFVDTNVLLYRYCNQDEGKRRIAARLLNAGGCVISVQVVNEFCNVTRRKFPAQFTAIEPVLQTIKETLPVEILLLEDSLSAVKISQRHNFQYYDALILACALRLGCEAVLSEDMQHGFVLDNRLAIVNPFIL
jgi:predicted nucleic acid-binding protein